MVTQKRKLLKEETWKAGSMLPERTTTMGDSEPVTTIRPFQIIRAEDTIIPNDNTWDKHENFSILSYFPLSRV